MFEDMRRQHIQGEYLHAHVSFHSNGAVEWSFHVSLLGLICTEF